MTQDLTPMKRYATSLQQFKYLLKSCRFSETSLNKSSAKSNWYGGEHYTTKGVEHDFILIFQSNEANNNSLALSFDFLGLPLEEQTVKASIKKGNSNDNIIMSEPITLTDFKEKINAFNKLHNDKKHNVDSFTVFNNFSKIFLNQELNMKHEVEQQLQAHKEVVEKVNETFKIPELEQAAKNAQEKLDAAIKHIDITIAKTPEYKKLKELKAEMAKLESAVIIKKNDIRKELNIESLDKEAYETREDLRVAKLYRNMELNKQSTNDSSSSRKFRY